MPPFNKNRRKADGRINIRNAKYEIQNWENPKYGILKDESILMPKGDGGWEKKGLKLIL